MPHKLIEKLCQLFLEECIHNFLQILLGVSQGIFVSVGSTLKRSANCTRTRTQECKLHSHSGVGVQIALQECNLHSRVLIALQSAKLHSRVLVALQSAICTPECQLHSRVQIALESDNCTPDFYLLECKNKMFKVRPE